MPLFDGVFRSISPTACAEGVMCNPALGVRVSRERSKRGLSKERVFVQNHG